MTLFNKLLPVLFSSVLISCCNVDQDVKERFSADQDLLLVHYDCKTDVDDLQSAAALATLLSAPRYSGIRYHAVAGTYGTQEGPFVPPDALFQIAFGDHWSNAHTNKDQALAEVKALSLTTLKGGGDIWIAEGGQSDFTALLVRNIRSEMPEINLKQRVHVVQHADWNEKVTTPADLDYVRKNTDYHKIPDGNITGNGTPGFRDPECSCWKEQIRDPQLQKIWQRAIELSNTYNGKDGRYNNESVASGGIDFSDFAEVCWILGITDINDAHDFFNRYGK